MNLSRLLLLVLAASPLSAAPATPSRLYASVAMTKAQKNSSTPLDSGIYVRGDDGQWSIFGPRILGVSSLALSPVDPKVMLLASADGVVRTTDGGKSWRKVTGWEVSDVRSIVFDAGDPNRVYAATSWGPLRSTDAGATWQLAQEGLTHLYCQTILADAAHPGRVILGTEDGISLSTDGARSWHRAKGPPATVLRLAQSASSPAELLAGTQGRGAWISRDGGETWTATDPETATANLYSVAIAPQEGTCLATGGWDTGVRVSTDGGKTWSDRTGKLPSRRIFVVAFDPDRPRRLWASTFEEGAFYSDDLGVTWQDGGLYGSYASDFAFLKPAH